VSHLISALLCSGGDGKGSNRKKGSVTLLPTRRACLRTCARACMRVHVRARTFLGLGQVLLCLPWSQTYCGGGGVGIIVGAEAAGLQTVRALYSAPLHALCPGDMGWLDMGWLAAGLLGLAPLSEAGGCSCQDAVCESMCCAPPAATAAACVCCGHHWMRSLLRAHCAAAHV
jgi:hypothetical protein